MNNHKQWIMLSNILLLPMIPLLFLYNQNTEYLSLRQVLITGLLLTIPISLFWWANKTIFKSIPLAFISCLIFIILLFAYDSYYDSRIGIYIFGNIHGYALIILVPALAYVATYLISRLFDNIEIDNAPYVISVMIIAMLFMNIYPLFTYVTSAGNFAIDNIRIKDSDIDNKLPNPNVYWILCDGLLGFTAMEKYFNEPQNDLTTELTSRGFDINKQAMLESGHKTRIAVPALMCPSYYDMRLKDILINHERSMNPVNYSYAEIYDSRFNNETIHAFDLKGYTTIAMSLEIEDIFFPTSDFYYYIASHYNTEEECLTVPYYVNNNGFGDSSYYKARYCAYQLGGVFLGGIPGAVFDLFNPNQVEKHQLTTINENTQDILLGSQGSIKYSALVDSIYDSLYNTKIPEPKFVVIHNFMPHFPYCYDYDGNYQDNITDIMSYPEHHTYAAKVLLNIVDMILDSDPDAVIVLQADHGLHEESERAILETFGDSDAPIMIWNSVFSAIRIPHQYKTDDLMYAIENPLNISRYLINSFVGENYQYIETDSP